MGSSRLLPVLLAVGCCTSACGGTNGSALSARAMPEPAASGGPAGSGPEELLPGQSVFAPGELLEVRLTIAPEFARELEEHGDREQYVPAAARLQGVAELAAEFVEIGVRHKGSYSLHHCWDEFDGVRSYADDCAKLSFKLKFDHADLDARFNGLKRLNLHSAAADPSKLHELIAYQTFRDFGVAAPRAVPARLFVNEQFRGLYIAVEDVDGRFARAHFPAGANGNLYKEVWPNPLFTEQELQAALQTNEEQADVSDMQAFAAAIARTSAQTFVSDLLPFVEIEALLRYIAVDLALRNWDGIMAFYSPRSSHNFFWYHDDGPAARFHLVPWDLDQTFWAFHPYNDPQQWVTAPPVPAFNEKPLDCTPRVVWEAAGSERITPPRCDKLLNLLAETHWARLVEIGRELLDGPFAAARLQRHADELELRLAPIVALDPTLDVQDWDRALREFADIVRASRSSFEALLDEGLVGESVQSQPERPPVQIDGATPDGGLHVGGITNFEFSSPLGGLPAGVYTYSDPLAQVGAVWNSDAPLSGVADLSFGFTFQRGPGLFDEWAGIGIASPESDVTEHSAIVAWLSSDRPREVRVRINSPAYEEAFGGILVEFGVDHLVDTTPRPFVIDFQRLYYPSWAKDDWLEGQGFAGSDAEALALVLQRFTGIIFGPSATFDESGELASENETGELRIDNIYFR